MPTRVGRHAEGLARRGRPDRHQRRASQIIAAEAFGLDTAEQVRVTTVDTDAAPYSGATGGSKTMYTDGPGRACRPPQEARERVLKIAAAELEASVDDLELVHGEVRVKGVPGKVKTLQEIYRLSASFGGKYEPVVGKGESAITEQSPGTGVHIARVRVDPETGRVEPIRYVDRPGRRPRDQPGARRGADPRRRRAGRRLGHVRGDRPRRVRHADHRQLHGLHDSQGAPDAGAGGGASSRCRRPSVRMAPSRSASRRLFPGGACIANAVHHAVGARVTAAAAHAGAGPCGDRLRLTPAGVRLVTANRLVATARRRAGVAFGRAAQERRHPNR